MSLFDGFNSPERDGLHSPDYTDRDFEVIDYQFYRLPKIPNIILRGPRFDPEGAQDFVTTIGAAQTLGVYVADPYPAIISRKMGVPVWNAAVGGATAGFFLKHEQFIDYANRSRFVILQVMTARSESNSRFASTERAELVRDQKYGDMVRTPVAWNRISQVEPENMARYIEESRASWEDNYKAILDRLHVPVTLFWFSPKGMDAPIDLASSSGAGIPDRYPQFVDGSLVRRIAHRANSLVICSSGRNEGHPLLSRFTGDVVEIDYSKLGALADPIKETHNNYYPSPEMHEDAADQILAEHPL